MPDIAAGIVKFQKDVFPKMKSLFDELAEGQAPDTLFITCSDSRVSPSLLTQTEPGDLFISRNAGNIVPPHSNHTGGVTSAIEYAVGALNVKHIVVCGHSGCGAMKGAMNPESLTSLPHVAEWLCYSRAAVQVVKEKGSDLPEKEKMEMLIRENVLLQLTHLKTHPYVAAHLAAKKISLHGWVYDIKSGAVESYDEQKEMFISVEEKYAEHVLKAVKAAS